MRTRRLMMLMMGDDLPRSAGRGCCHHVISVDLDRPNDDPAVRAAPEAQRHGLAALRTDGTNGDAAFQRVEAELDWTELGWTQAAGAGL